MHTRNLPVLAVVMLVVPSAVHAQTAVTPAGSGTDADPYEISKIGHLVWMGDTVADSAGKYYTMTADIDASATAGWNDPGTSTDVLEGFKPIGTSGPPYTALFRGILDGQGHIITGLVINRPSTNPAGLFGFITEGGVVRNLGLVGARIRGGTQVGALVGGNSGMVSGCHASGAVTGESTVGGLVGTNFRGTVSNCFADGAITEALCYAGGVVGVNYYGTVSNCRATGSVMGGGVVGGLIGYNKYGTVSSCYATGAVTGGNAVGGLIGSGGGAVSNCCATGAVTGTSDSVGGLIGSGGGSVSNCYATGAVAAGGRDVGGLLGGSVAPCTISNCYATGAVTGKHAVGGLVGGSDGPGRISNCYSTGAATGGYGVGGLVGYSRSGVVSDSYWDMQTSGLDTSAGGTGKTTAEMKQRATFGVWDFTSMWGIGENVTYPWLRRLTVDTDGDGVPDTQDNCPQTANLDQADADADGVGDACDACPGYDDRIDCNSNGVPDGCDLAAGTSTDCNADRVPDECQIEGSDCNTNGIPDDCDIADGSSEDCNANGVPDECERDADGDGLVDDCDACPDSDRAATIVIDGCDTRVPNRMLGHEGCTMADRIAECADGARNHGVFVSRVANLANAWRHRGLINIRQAAAIQRCAAQADIPRRHEHGENHGREGHGERD